VHARAWVVCARARSHNRRFLYRSTQEWPLNEHGKHPYYGTPLNEHGQVDWINGDQFDEALADEGEKLQAALTTIMRAL
jgi:hypothetical protein